MKVKNNCMTNNNINNISNNNNSNSNDDMREERKTASKYAHLLVANSMLQDYIKFQHVSVQTKDMFEYMKGLDIVVPDNVSTVEPEKFVEDWMSANISGGTEEWRDSVRSVFMKLLLDRGNKLS